MYGAILKSSILASVLGAIVFVAALTASSVAPVSTKLGQKSDLLVAAAYHTCPVADCEEFHDGFGGYQTSVDRNETDGVFTLTRTRTALID
ncbi:hypothetical protein [Acuticoccus sp. I52.16.1]|uniref:hypothetical protein n=1 Tax=Acuticoccus sp. I52.16.1 TaxID=2928472 RepID=UPI001FD506A1|nr:hypothetical protein [Acuticoccus sp. I52.16.1]UOM33926.1 hypothetical protein MRB58_19125 [Acuticoccus sp. I52.16.1]